MAHLRLKFASGVISTTLITYKGCSLTGYGGGAHQRQSQASPSSSPSPKTDVLIVGHSARAAVTAKAGPVRSGVQVLRTAAYYESDCPAQAVAASLPPVS